MSNMIANSGQHALAPASLDLPTSPDEDLLTSENAFLERTSSPPSERSYDSDSDPSFDESMDYMKTLHEANGARNESYHILFPIFNSAVQLDARCPIVNWVKETPRPTKADRDLEYCKSKIVDTLHTAKQLLSWSWERSHTDSDILSITSALAILSRSRLWRAAFTELGILEFYLDALTEHVNDSDGWIDPALRLIANCCALSRRTKQLVFGRAPIERLINRLEHENEADLALLVLHSICNGYEPAELHVQKEHHITMKLLSGLQADRFQSSYIDQLCDFLGCAPDTVDHSGIEPADLRMLLDAPKRFNLSDDSISDLTKLITALLKDEALQDMLVRHSFSRFMTFFLNTYTTNIRDASIQSLKALQGLKKRLKDPAYLDESRTALIDTFSNVALRCRDLAEIRDHIHIIIRWLSVPRPQIQICACIFLGNLVCKHAQYGNELLRQYGFAKSLGDCMICAPNHDVLMSALNLLQNVAVSPENRKILGEAGLLRALNHVGCDQSADCARRALYHTRQLMSDCLPNVRILLQRQTLPPPDLTRPPLMRNLFRRFEESEDTLVKVEIGRIVAEAWRTVNKGR